MVVRENVAVVRENVFGTRLRVTQEYTTLLNDVEQFYFHEANLLDFRRYNDWLDLLADDIRYFMPLVRNVRYGEWEREYSRQGEDLAWFDDDKENLIMRVRQIESGIHWAEEPSSRVSHLISNLMINEARPSLAEPTEVDTSCRFFVYRNRLMTETDQLVGKRLDTLRKIDGDWKITRRTLILDQNILLAKNITVLL
jgi:3-phenylpropionate/cinnamic acid dioxygenase small subunit